MDDGSGVPDGDSEEVENVLGSDKNNKNIVVHLFTEYMVKISVYLVVTTTKAHVDLIL